ncbi:probable amino acid ABC transporter [Laribacter hongkongensis HLHK9]|uniref:Probable amino acid ABC transporter n=1 Tax=Laribacter hongkongensis (strain HLHK9) TaxID=557598 RepID=C1D9I2_LARHH|nr:branched-chain amino acid ABC transporter substrate-binding protein [Laribacter hongkongensis]ACO75084.1 probable amino acid ABC transporter [Laribacter hongkongensis HLHK9]
MQFARLSLIAAAVATLAACGQKAETKPAAEASALAEEVVKIASVAPLTGNIAHLGKDNESGVKLAADDLNAQNIVIDGKKIKFEVVSEDDQADPKVATQVAQRLVDQKVSAVIGHLNSGTTIPASKIYADAGIPQISPSSTNPAYTTQGFKTAYRDIANDVQQGTALGNFAVDSLKAKNIAVIDDRTAYGQGIADEFVKAAEAKGAKVVKREFTTNNATDFMAILTSIKGAKPDVIFYGGMDAQGGPLAKQMQKLGLQAKLLGADGLQSPEYIKLAGDAATGTYASSVGMPKDKMPGFKSFNDKYKAKYGEVQIYSPYSYDATMIVAEAMKRANSTDPAKYAGEIGKTNHNGVTGNIQFDAKGDIKDGAVTVYQVKDGGWVALETVGGNTPVAAPAPAEEKKQ